MTSDEILRILENAKDKNGEIPMSLVRQAFSKLRPAQPQRMHGHWIKVCVTLANNQNGHLTEWECSECKEHQLIKSKFCPECGADMREESNETQNDG